MVIYEKTVLQGGCDLACDIFGGYVDRTHLAFPLQLIYVCYISIIKAGCRRLIILIFLMPFQEIFLASFASDD
jgi:hypothetical protein